MRALVSSAAVLLPLLLAVATMTTMIASAHAQRGLSADELKGYNKFIEDWKKVCPDSNNMTSFCDGYLTGASIRSSGP